MINTFIIILEQILLYFPLASGAYISFSLLKLPDLSLEAAFVFGAILSSKLLLILGGADSIYKVALVLIAGILGGMCVGLCNAVLRLSTNLSHLLTSILTIGLFYGINLFILGSSNLSISSVSSIFGNSELYVLLIVFVLVFGALYFMFNRQIGYALAVYGNNSGFFSNFDISSRFVFIFGMLLSNGLAGLSGALIAQSNGFIDIEMGARMALLCITVLILGKAIIRNRVLSILVPLVGVSIYFGLQQLLIALGANLKYFTAIQAIIVLAVLILISKRRALNELGV